MTQRHTKILELLSRHQRSEVSLLSELLGVSQVTVRKDLDMLEERGLVHREHGIACLNLTNDTGKRLAFNYNVKKRIAKWAAAMVDEKETVTIESGSCCALLAEELANEQKDVTIITNSVFTANFIRHASHTNIILLGGCYRPESQVLVGPMTRKCSKIFSSDKFFVGTDGFIPGFGFTGKDHLRSKTVIDLSKNARNIFVLTDSEKFYHQGALGLVRLENVTGVFTDDHIPMEIEQQLIDHHIALHKVPEHEPSMQP